MGKVCSKLKSSNNQNKAQKVFAYSNSSVQRITIHQPKWSQMSFRSKSPLKTPSTLDIRSDLSTHHSPTGISSQIINIANTFWQPNIACTNIKKEIGCAIYFSMIVDNKEIKRKLTKHIELSKQLTIEKYCLKFIDMIGRLITTLTTTRNNHNNYNNMFSSIGIEVVHFKSMLFAMHETFSYYFPYQYSIEVQYSIDQIFNVIAQQMTQHYPMKSINNQNNYNVSFLQNLHLCLKSNIGQKYLYKFLQQTFCDEIAIFLQSLNKFKSDCSDEGRFIIAKFILKNNIQPNAAFSINISHQTRFDIMKRMKELESTFVSKCNVLNVSLNLFEDAEMEIHRLIMTNHWNKFVATFNQFNNDVRFM